MLYLRPSTRFTLLPGLGPGGNVSRHTPASLFDNKKAPSERQYLKETEAELHE